MTLTLRQLITEYQQITCPVTLVCAGNRRKEQNQVRKSKGFSWGAAGVSTALFTGALMSDVIREARPRKGARYVCMEGGDDLVCTASSKILIKKRSLTVTVAQWPLCNVNKTKLGHGS